MTGLDPALHARALAWVADDPSAADRAEIGALIRAATADDAAGDTAAGDTAAGDTAADTAAAELAVRFADRLHFGTAGLRGPLRAGPDGMNRAVVGRAAAGLTAYLRDHGTSGPVVIGYDARHGSAEFARDTAEIVAGAGLHAVLLPRPLPTPVLAFAVRHLAAAAGVMVTASHNPAADNGYKVYLGAGVTGDVAGAGAQIVPPADREIEAAIEAVDRLAGVARGDYETAGDDVLDAYLAAVAAIPSGSARDLSVAYTPMHGVGGDTLGAAFDAAGFDRPFVVAAQAEPDPDFPTVAFPNPEEPGALDLVRALADEIGADVVIANDPDADRCAVALPGRVLTGDELGVLLADHLLRAGIRGLFATTIVSSSMLSALCAAYGVEYAETLTGFKWIVRAGDHLAYGYEEALGYCVAPQLVRDKDGISTALLVADLAATLKSHGATLADRLDELAAAYGVHATGQLSMRVSDPAPIAVTMSRLRAEPPARLLGRDVGCEDLLPTTDGLRLAGDGVRVVIRPSGTEPKLKCYLQVIAPVQDSIGEAVAVARVRADALLARLRVEIAEALGIDAADVATGA